MIDTPKLDNLFDVIDNYVNPKIAKPAREELALLKGKLVEHDRLIETLKLFADQDHWGPGEGTIEPEWWFFIEGETRDPHQIAQDALDGDALGPSVKPNLDAIAYALWCAHYEQDPGDDESRDTWSRIVQRSRDYYLKMAEVARAAMAHVSASEVKAK